MNASSETRLAGTLAVLLVCICGGAVLLGRGAVVPGVLVAGVVLGVVGQAVTAYVSVDHPILAPVGRFAGAFLASLAAYVLVGGQVDRAVSLLLGVGVGVLVALAVTLRSRGAVDAAAET